MNPSKVMKISTAITPTAGAAGTTDINGTELDMAGWEGVLVIVRFGSITTGAVTSIKMQQDTATGMAAAADLEGTGQTIADSDDDKTFYTETMARLLCQQGRYDRAAEVYRYLLAQSPYRKDLEKALETALCAKPRTTTHREGIQELIERWVTQMLRYKALRQLQQLSIFKATDKRPGE